MKNFQQGHQQQGPNRGDDHQLLPTVPPRVGRLPASNVAGLTDPTGEQLQVVHPVDKTMVFQSSMLHVMVLSKLSWHELLQRFHAVDEII